MQKRKDTVMETTPKGDALLSKPLNEFKNYKQNVQNRSALTIDEYLLDLRIFFKFIKAVRDELDPTEENFEKIDMRTCDYAFMESITADEPSYTAFATSDISALVGRGFSIIDSSISVAVMTRFPRSLHFLIGSIIK